MAHTGENEQALRKIIDFIRLMSIVILLFHFYFFVHEAFQIWGLTSEFADRITKVLFNTGLFQSVLHSKLVVFGLLAISLIGAKGKKDEKMSFRKATLYIIYGALIFFLCDFILLAPFGILALIAFYIGLTSIGYILILTGGTWLSKLIKVRLRKDIFNKLNESFPQEERLLENEFSINLPAAYNLKGKKRRSWINVINPFRSLLVIGTPGAGKSYFVVRHIITQHIAKGFTMFIYDFKYDDLTRIAYNTLLRNTTRYPVAPKFYVINFEDLSRSHRCNPLDPTTMDDITDATESSRTIMLGLNREWIKKQGDFFVESPINFVTGIIWFLRKYEEGKY
ncbi:MAG TPA: YWFCY domain-containing protein, partial [Cyclobacteriaceae bacterium]|nr:YWFCY domain-containing protein [Cyclobacteriaceae bacterium]